MDPFIQQKIEEFQTNHKNHGRLLIKCPDQSGIVSAITDFLFSYGCNIVESNQYTTNPDDGVFFMRIEFACPSLEVKMDDIRRGFTTIATKFSMEWRFTPVYQIKKIAIFVSKQLHCLQELLWESQSGNLMAEIALVISNHRDAEDLVKQFGIPFYHIPINKDIRVKAEAQQLQLLKDYAVDFTVLARYMQILTPEFVKTHPDKIINIHHSFLPAFIGANPYERAYDRGVKLIGATSHYVTNDLDEGPIIEQDVARVNHRYNSKDLKNKGRLVERSVLARAVEWHIDDRIIVHGNKTIIL